MSVSRSLSFLWTPWSLALSVLLLLITAGLGFVAWRRSGYSRSMGLLELLRLALVAIAAAMLNQPEWIEEYRPEEKPSVAVLWDASPSMETRDVVARGKSSSSPQSRREAVAPLAESASWLKLRERMNVVVQPFSPPQPGRGTDLHEPLARALEKIQNLRGSCWPRTATGTRVRRRSRPRPGCGSRGCPSSLSPWAARPACPTSSCCHLTPRLSAWPASRFASRSRSKVPCRENMLPPSSFARPMATRCPRRCALPR